MNRKIFIIFIPVTIAMWFFYSIILGAEANNNEKSPPLENLVNTPSPTHMPEELRILLYENQVKFSDVSPLGSPVRGNPGDWWADVIIGQPAFSQITPNQVVGNRVFNPGGVYVDRSKIPNRIYVYDAGNSRILGFSSIGVCETGPNIAQRCTSNSDCLESTCKIQNHKAADIILGQVYPTRSTCNSDSAFQNYPHFPSPKDSTLCGLSPESVSILEGGSMVTMASDPQGNLYHPDFFNNRILRYDNPFTKGRVADYVWGQIDFRHRECNLGRYYPDNKSLCLAPPPQIGSIKAGVVVDSQNNLWVTDTQNNRVLRFPYNSLLGAPAKEADLVLGQADFSTRNSGNGLNQMNNPGSVRVNANGNVYVLDGADGYGTHGRLLVFRPPLSIGMAASRVVDGLGEPTGIELDSKGRVWINNSDQGHISLMVNGNLQPIIEVGDYRGAGGLGIDLDNNIYITGWGTKQVLVYSPPTYEEKSRFLQADEFGSPNSLSPRGIMDPRGLEVTSSQLIVADGSRLLFWDNPTELENNYPPANGVVGQPNLHTRQGPEFGRMRADNHNRLWVVKEEQTGTDTQILAYRLPLVKGSSPIIQISSPITLLGGGEFSWSVGLFLSGLAYQPKCDCLWLSEPDYNRVFRIRNVSSPQRVVDIVLGQKKPKIGSNIGIHCNQGRDSDNGYIHPTSPSRDSLCHPGGLTLDKRGNLFVSDHNLEVAGNWRLLEYNAANLPTSSTTAIIGVPASRVYGRNGSFTEPDCIYNDPLCGPWEPVFDSNNQMVIGFNGYLGPRFPQVYKDPLFNSLPYTSLLDFYSHAYSARFDPLNNLYVLDHTRNRILIYWSP